MMTMEKLKKRFNTSPMIKKKGAGVNGCPSAGGVRGDGTSSSGHHLKTFGASLEELAFREKSDVPLIVRKICEYIVERGLSIEGLFRINGNVRLIQNLMASYETNGDIDLSECNDVHSVAGLLKRFVRDLSVGLIPEQLTEDFIRAVEVNGESEDECISEIRKLLDNLSQESYATLRYLCYFLWKVCQKEAENKMSAGSLGICFGPNVFRCGENCLGLSLSYTHCNRAMTLMISSCHRIFDNLEAVNLPSLSSNTPSPQGSRKATPPPRPPPPLIPSPGESPRLLLQAAWGRPHSDDLAARSSSPFLQDNSETECSLSRDMVTGPPAPSVSNIIHYVISDSIFGDDENDHQPEPEGKTSPSPKPRKRHIRCQSSPALDQIDKNDEVSESRKRPAGPPAETEAHGPDSANSMPRVAPRRSRRSNGVPSSSSGLSVDAEVNNNLMACHSLPDLKMMPAADNQTPSDGDQSVGEVTSRMNCESDEDRSIVLVQDLRRQIQSLKRHVRRFEEEYARTNGHKPSVSEKNSDRRVRGYLSDLAVARRRLRTLQDASDDSEPFPKPSARSRSVEALHMNGTGPRDDPASPRPRGRILRQPPAPLRPLEPRADIPDTSSNGREDSDPSVKLRAALEDLEHELQVKRELSGRPESLEAMTWEQVREEKVTLQRSLLNYESRYGRPRSLEDKEVMRPVYDRYRTVKRVLSGGDRRRESTDTRTASVVVGAASVISADEGTSAGGDLFAVTQDFQARMRREGLMSASLVSNPTGPAPTAVQRRTTGRTADPKSTRDKRRSQPVMPTDESLGEYSIGHLKEEENRLRTEKKRLQRLLKQFERNFEQNTGRRLQKEDRKPMQDEYLQYKKIKIRLRDLTNAIAMSS